MSESTLLSPQDQKETDEDSILRLFEKQEPEFDFLAWRDTPEAGRIKNLLKQKFQQARSMRAQDERRWNLNYALYSGQHYVTQTSAEMQRITGNTLRPSGKKLGKPNLKINRTRSICRTEQAKFLSKRPGASVVPATADDTSQAAAQAGEQAWTSTRDRRHLDAEVSDAVFWAVVTGNGFIKTYWDDDLKDEHADILGDIRYLSVDPYKMFFPDLRLRNIQDQPYLFHAYAKPTEWLKLQYEEELEGKELASDCLSTDGIMEAAYATPRGQQESKDFDSNLVIEAWVKPGAFRELRQGGRVVIVGEHIVAAEIDGLPYEHGDYPFSHFPHIDTGKFYGASIIEDLEDLQRSYNKLRSAIQESWDKMGKPQLAAAKGSISGARMTNEIGLVVDYKFGMGAPTPIPLQQLPQYMLNDLENIKADMEDISGQHQVTKGSVPPGVTAAAAISYLQEADDSYLSTSYENMERMYESVARQTLNLIVQYWDEPRRIKIIGEDQAFDSAELSGANVKGGTDIRVEKGSSLPQSRAAKQALAMDLMLNGVIDNSQGLEMMGVGGSKSIVDLIQIDKRQAMRENIQFRNLTLEDFQEYDEQWNQLTMGGQNVPLTEDGQPMEQPPIIPVNDFDNHEVHIEEHNRFRKSQAFLMLPEETKQAIQAHVVMHEQTLQGKMLQQALSQIPTDGTVPGVNGTVEGEGGMEEEGNMGGLQQPPAEMDTNATPGQEETQDPFEGMFS